MADKDPKRTVKATHFDWKVNDYPDHGEPGQACRYTADCLVLACPGCGRFSGMTCGHPKPPNDDGATWDITGGSLDDVTTLTLSPSINCVGCCGWHGYLTNGVFAPC